MDFNVSDRSTEDWLRYLGDQFRESRIRLNLSQEDIAKLANVSVGTVKNLEGGKGSSMSSMVQLTRAIKRTDWLTALAPPVTVSPLQMLRRSRNSKVRLRVGKRT